jgi:phage-related minor tail protein
LTGDLGQIIAQIAKVLNLPVGGLLGAIENLIKALGPLLVQLLNAIEHLVQELLKDLSGVTSDLINQLVKTGGLFSVLLQLVGQLQTIVNSLIKAGVHL